MLAVLACLLTACSGSTEFDRSAATLARVDLRGPDSALVKRCDDPVLLPGRALNQAEMEALWGRDRAALVVCRERHSGLLRFFERRDVGLRGNR